MHADVPADQDAAGIHVFPDTLDPRRVTFEYNLDVFRGDGCTFDKDPEQFGERAFLVALEHDKVGAFQEIAGNDRFCLYGDVGFLRTLLSRITLM